MKLALVILCLTVFAFGQSEDQRHPSSIERFEHLRILPPATIKIATDGKSMIATVVERARRRGWTLFSILTTDVQ
jgi:hypothetical protein